MAKHPNKTIKWKLKSLRNWIYNKWMRYRGHTPTTFNFRTNTYNYENRKKLEEELSRNNNG